MESAETDAAKPVDNQVFFIRYAQRVVHILTMHSAAGRLYEVDVRLRPSGKGGMLITRIGAFAEYQEKEAWTWEHQALLHARAVAGDGALRAAFERVRMDILQRCVRRDSLRTEVREMRERMSRSAPWPMRPDRRDAAILRRLPTAVVSLLHRMVRMRGSHGPAGMDRGQHARARGGHPARRASPGAHAL